MKKAASIQLRFVASLTRIFLQLKGMDTILRRQELIKAVPVSIVEDAPALACEQQCNWASVKNRIVVFSPGYDT
jgi:hypothetical protein